MAKCKVTCELINGDVAEHILDCAGSYDLTQESERDNWASAVGLTTILDCMHGEDCWDSWQVEFV
jgi:hypothetical protein